MIAVDYELYTEDPGKWKALGEVIVVKRGHDNGEKLDVPLYFADHRPKVVTLERLGVEVDIWVEKNPFDLTGQNYGECISCSGVSGVYYEICDDCITSQAKEATKRALSAEGGKGSAKPKARRSRQRAK